MEEKDAIIQDLKKALARAGREKEIDIHEKTEQKESRNGRKRPSVLKRRREEEEQQTGREGEEGAESPTEEDFDGRRKKRGKSSPQDSIPENEQDKGSAVGRVSEGAATETDSGKKAAGSRRLLPRISGMVDRKGATALGPLTRALLSKQVTLPKLKSSLASEKENVALSNA